MGDAAKPKKPCPCKTKGLAAVGAANQMAVAPGAREDDSGMPAYQQLAAEAGTFLEHLCLLNIKSRPNPIRRTGIICTIGPASKSPEMLVQMFEKGMCIARLNFSHGSYEYHAETIENVRKAVDMYSEKIGRKHVIGIALDTKGPEIRTGLLEGGGSAEVELVTGNTIELTTDKSWEETGTADKVYVDYENIINVIQPGNCIYIDDGLMSLICQSKSGDTLTCTIENGGMLGSRKGVNLPGVPVDLPAVSEKDKSDLRFGVEQGVDMVFASFIRTADALQEIRDILGPEGKNILIISKIENQQGMDNIDAIIEASDGIMVARGDLGIEIPTQKIFVAQKTILARCNKVGKTVICATQMLESMTKKPRPTRAESSDVANAVLDGADCVMLSGETAKGTYPLECVQTMSDICKEAEAAIWQKDFYTNITSTLKLPISVPESSALAAVEASVKNFAQAIIVLTITGNSAHLVSKYRPRCPIITVTSNEQVARQMYLHRGCVPLIFEGPEDPDTTKDTVNRLKSATEYGRSLNILMNGDIVVILTGSTGQIGSTNTVRLVTVSADMEGLG